MNRILPFQQVALKRAKTDNKKISNQLAQVDLVLLSTGFHRFELLRSESGTLIVRFNRGSSLPSSNLSYVIFKSTIVPHCPIILSHLRYLLDLVRLPAVLGLTGVYSILVGCTPVGSILMLILLRLMPTASLLHSRS